MKTKEAVPATSVEKVIEIVALMLVWVVAYAMLTTIWEFKKLFHSSSLGRSPAERSGFFFKTTPRAGIFNFDKYLKTLSKAPQKASAVIKIIRKHIG